MNHIDHHLKNSKEELEPPKSPGTQTDHLSDALDEVYEESLSTVDVEDEQLVRRVKIVKVWLEANVFNEKHLGEIK